MDEDVTRVGYPNMWNPVYKKYKRLFHTAGKCTSVLNDMREHSTGGDEMSGTILRMVFAASNTFGAIQILVFNGLGADALKLTRSIYETELNILWLKQHPDDVQDFLKFQAICRKRAYDELDEQQRDEISQATSDEIIADYNAALPRFLTKNGKPRNEWCRVSLRKRAEESGMIETHETYYRAASAAHHGDVMGLLSQTDPEGTLDMAPSWNNLDSALLSGIGSFLRCLNYLDEIAHFGFKGRLNEVNGDYVSALGELSSHA